MAVRSQNGSANGDHETSSYIGTSSAASPRYRFGRSPASSTSGSWNSRRGLFAIEHTFANWRRPRLVLKKKRIRTSSDMPSMLPYILFAIAGLAGILLPFAELLSQGIPKLAKNFNSMAMHLPTRSVAKRPIEGVHFDAGVLHGESRTLGNESALMYVMEFTDFFCEHCQEAHHTTMLPLISSSAVKEGKLRIESHPLAYLGEESLRAAHAALCAQEQHKYWEMRDLLFQVSLEEKLKKKEQQEETETNYNYTPMTFDSLILKRLAHLSGLDAVSFAKCLHSERHVDEIRRLNRLAHKLGVRGTPYFVFDRAMHPSRRNKFQDVHVHREGVVSKTEVIKILKLEKGY